MNLITQHPLPKNPHGSELLKVTHRHWYHRIFGGHTLWARFVTNILRWPYRGSGLRRPDLHAVDPLFKGKKIRFTYELDEHERDPDFWKRQEIGLGFDKKPEA